MSSSMRSTTSTLVRQAQNRMRLRVGVWFVAGCQVGSWLWLLVVAAFVCAWVCVGTCVCVLSAVFVLCLPLYVIVCACVFVLFVAVVCVLFACESVCLQLHQSIPKPTLSPNLNLTV